MAVEIKDGKKILVTPVSAEDLKDIHIGDIVYLTGDITTCRDVAHRRVVEEGREIPVDVRDAAILHAGPIIRPLGDDKYEMVSVGPTTSMRMEKFEYEFVETTGVRVIVGKGGMKENTERACKDFGAIPIDHNRLYRLRCFSPLRDRRLRRFRRNLPRLLGHNRIRLRSHSSAA